MEVTAPGPDPRVDLACSGPVRPDRRYVLYWQTAARRTRWSPALDRALAWCRHLGRPLLVFEPVRCGYQYASQRHHRWIIDGMVDNAHRYTEIGIGYLPFVERIAGQGRGLLAALARDACVVIGDDHPGFFLPRMRAAAAAQLDVRTEWVDDQLVPAREAGRFFKRAVDQRRWLQKRFWGLPASGAVAARPAWVTTVPQADPLAGYDLGTATPPPLPRWQVADLSDPAALLAHLPAPAPVRQRGGERAGQLRWSRFLPSLGREYSQRSRHPDAGGTSGLSAYLHYGQVGPHQLVFELLTREQARAPTAPARGKMNGWWGLSEGAEGFLNQIATWRELAYLAARYMPDFGTWACLPEWARHTLSVHRADPRAGQIGLTQLERAATPDPLWNAAQRQLLRDGVIHGQLRMLWAKLVLGWAPTPQTALAWLDELNDRYAIDGRDPISRASILWTFGLFDRAWGPERPIFGKVRYMTSQSNQKKLRLSRYLEEFGRADPDRRAG